MANYERTYYRAAAVVLGLVLVIEAAGQSAASGVHGLSGTRAELRALRAREAELQALRRAAVDEWHDASVRWQAAGEVGPPPPRPERWTRHSLDLTQVQVRIRQLRERSDS